MAPFPEEVDVFTAPHWRMKQLVGLYCDKVLLCGAPGSGRRAGGGEARAGLRAGRACAAPSASRGRAPREPPPAQLSARRCPREPASCPAGRLGRVPGSSRRGPLPAEGLATRCPRGRAPRGRAGLPPGPPGERGPFAP